MKEPWVEQLSSDDLAFLKRFLLASGSLKSLAREYMVSYPTIRLRLDRLIEKVKILESARSMSEVERLLRLKYAEGKMDSETFTEILKAYEEDQDERMD